MSESGLTLGLRDFRHAVSEFLYGGDGAFDRNSAPEQDRIKRTIDAGLRQFYSPVSVDSSRVHKWSFLSPPYSMSLNAAYSVGTVQITAGVVTLTGGTFPAWAASGMLMINGMDYSVATYTNGNSITLTDTSKTFSGLTKYTLHQDDYALPDNFSSFVGPITFNQVDNSWFRVELIGEGRIRYFRQFQGYTGLSLNQPWMAAVQPKVMDATLGTRNTLMFWPRVMNTATVTFTYRVRADSLSDTNIYPYGASDHSDTIMASIMACAEMAEEQSRGVYWDNFQRLLQSSIELDASTNRPELLGYNKDDSDLPEAQLGRHWSPSAITYRGMQVP